MARDTSTLPSENVFKPASTQDEMLLIMISILDNGRRILDSMTGNTVASPALKDTTIGAMMAGYAAAQQMATAWLALEDINNNG